MRRTWIRRLSSLVALGTAAMLPAAVARAAEPILQGYADYAALEGQLKDIAQPPLASLQSLGRTLGGREVYVLKIGTGNVDEKPALLLVGTVHAPHLLGSELAVRLAQRLVEGGKRDAEVRKLLDRRTFYIIPRPAPDACEALFRKPYWERVGNERPADDDRDFAVDEDGPEDLNGDGLVTMLRVEDPAGTYIPSPADPRVMVDADPKKGEHGRYKLYTEGIDNDKDERFNEDPPGGVAFNRNFTFRYPYFGPNAGPNQVSDVETRAVADFAFDHPNIAAVFCFSPEDNLFIPWKPEPSAEQGRIKTAVLSSDAPYLDFVGKEYQRIHGGKDAPASPRAEGAFSTWAYFHFGRWSLAARGWWIPKVESATKGEKKGREEGKDGEGEDPAPGARRGASPDLLPLTPDPSPARGEGSSVETAKGEGKMASPKLLPSPPTPLPQAGEGSSKGRRMFRFGAKSVAGGRQAEREGGASEVRRPEEDLNALRWFAREGIDGFVPWQPVKDPDFPDKKVEVGGFKPFLRLNPPAKELDPLAEKHWQFLRRLVELLPRLAIRGAKAESLGGGVWRVTVTVANEGYLPTESQMGRITRQPHPLQVAIDLPNEVTLVTGYVRRQMPSLAGSGAQQEHTWLVKAPEDKPAELKVRVWSPSVGSDQTAVTLKAK